MKTTKEVFANILDAQLSECEIILGDKAQEYAEDADRLHNFRVAAALAGCTPEAALAGMMAKHTVSIYDMCTAKDPTFTLPLWKEKITDHINYLILLRAMVEERAASKPKSAEEVTK